MVVLIIEGCDLSGKSTAIEKISKYFKDGFLIKNLYKPVNSADEKIYNQYWSIINVIDKLQVDFLILDRFFPSQAVYSYLRGEDEMDSDLIKDIDYYCARNNFLYVYLDTPVHELEHRFDIRGDEHIKKDDLSLLSERYDKFWAQTEMRKIKINTMRPDWLMQLENFIKGE